MCRIIKNVVDFLVDSEEIIGHVIIVGHGALLRMNFGQVEVEFFGVLFLVLLRDFFEFFLPQRGVFSFVNNLSVADPSIYCFYYDGQPPHKHVSLVFIM